MTHNEETLQKRRNELEEIKQTSGQIAGMAKQIKQDIHEQGMALDQVENNVIEAMDNVNIAEQEIKEADKISKKSNKKLIWIIIVVIIGIAIILGITIPFIKS